MAEEYTTRREGNRFELLSPILRCAPEGGWYEESSELGARRWWMCRRTVMRYAGVGTGQRIRIVATNDRNELDAYPFFVTHDRGLGIITGRPGEPYVLEQPNDRFIAFAETAFDRGLMYGYVEIVC